MINSVRRITGRFPASGGLRSPVRPQLERLWRKMKSRPVTDLSRRTIVCPCHDATLHDLRSAWNAGFRHPETLKRATAVLMGPCQGKYCAPVVGAILAELRSETSREYGSGTGRQADCHARQLQRRPSARPPLYPVRLGDLAGAGEEQP